jgi:hypothetical protein
LSSSAQKPTAHPDVLEGRNHDTGIPPSSITITGRSDESLRDLRPPLKWLLGYAVRQALAEQGSSTTAPANQPRPNDPLLKSLDSATTILGTVLLVHSAFFAAILIVLGVRVIVHMDVGSRSEGGAFYVGIDVLLASAWLVGSLVGLVWRRKG